jgi:hypothetical protein
MPQKAAMRLQKCLAEIDVTTPSFLMLHSSLIAQIGKILRCEDPGKSQNAFLLSNGHRMEPGKNRMVWKQMPHVQRHSGIQCKYLSLSKELSRHLNQI